MTIRKTLRQRKFPLLPLPPSVPRPWMLCSDYSCATNTDQMTVQQEHHSKLFLETQEGLRGPNPLDESPSVFCEQYDNEDVENEECEVGHKLDNPECQTLENLIEFESKTL